MKKFSTLIAALYVAASLGCQAMPSWMEAMQPPPREKRDSTLDAPLRERPSGEDRRAWWDKPFDRRAQEIDERLGR